MIVLAMVLLAVRNDRFGFAELVQHDDELAALDLLNFAGEQVSDARRELIADSRALTLAHPLDDSLLRRLHRGTSEHREVDGLFHDVADLEAVVERARVVERDLAARVFYARDDCF